jgi:hypothetical protein
MFTDSFDNIVNAHNIASELSWYGSRVVGTFENNRGGTVEDVVVYGTGELDIAPEPLGGSAFLCSFAPSMSGMWRPVLVVNGEQISNPRWPAMSVSPGTLHAEGVRVEGLGNLFQRFAGHHYKLAVRALWRLSRVPLKP